MMINELPKIMAEALFFTIIIEFIVARIVFRIKDKKDLLNIVLVNFMTNPIVTSIPVYINITYDVFTRNVVLICLEVLVIIVEGIVYRKYFKYNKINPFIISILLNLTSYLCGFLR